MSSILAEDSDSDEEQKLQDNWLEPLRKFKTSLYSWKSDTVLFDEKLVLALYSLWRRLRGIDTHGQVSGPDFKSKRRITFVNLTKEVFKNEDKRLALVH